jgi:hypothetical protein
LKQEKERRRLEQERTERQEATRRFKELEEVREKERVKEEEKVADEPKPRFESRHYFLESDLSRNEIQELREKGWDQLKTSPDGKSGASFIWVECRYNEGKEHAFFCYLIEAMLKKHTRTVKINVSGGPDVEFKFAKRKYCFDVETGTNYSRRPENLAQRYKRYQTVYDEVFIFVTSKNLKYKYGKFGEVITRAKLQETIDEIFG